MKKTLRLVGVAAMVLLLAASCKKEEKNNGEKQMMTFSAGIEQTGAKTGLQPGSEAHAFKQVWKKGDAIRVNDNKTVITLDEGCDDKETGTFTGEVTATGKYYAVYPTSATLSGSTATFTLPESQDYVAGSYESDLAPMAAYTENNELNFRNLCGLMELSLVGDGITVTGLELSCDKLICGSANFDMSNFSTAKLTMDDHGVNTPITMNFTDGVALKGTTPTSFIFVLPPVTEGNFSLKVTYVAGANTIQKTIALPANISITASQVVYNTTSYELVGVNGTVTTGEVTDVTSSDANVAYTVTPNGVSQARQHGVCYGTSENPSISGTCTEATGTTYTASLPGLAANTTYHVRAYAIFERASRNEGDVVVYGEDKSFKTEEETPTTEASATLNTNDVRIGPKGFWVSGTISGVSSGSSAEVGVCYSHTNPDPKYADGHSTISTSASTFSVDVNGLDFGTSYYYRSYIKYNGGVAYGTPVYTLTTESATSTAGTGTVSDTYYFSVSPTKKVVFSKGDLQYNAGLNEWRFAEHQYDVISNQYNKEPHENYPVWIDMFGYGTSGQRENGQTYPLYQPWSYGTNTQFCQHDLRGTVADWGVNPIVNGGNEGGLWYTLTMSEANHILGVGPEGATHRNNAANLRGLAKVGDRPGLVILPDGWVKPDGINFTPTDSEAAFTSNVYSISDWEKMEQNGAVFLPVSATRSGTGVSFYDYNDSNYPYIGQLYWLGQHHYSNTHSKRIMLHNGNDFGTADGSSKAYGCHVRLVKTY